MTILKRKLQILCCNAFYFANFLIIKRTLTRFARGFAMSGKYCTMLVMFLTALVGGGYNAYAWGLKEKDAAALMLAFYFTEQRPSGEINIAIIQDDTKIKTAMSAKNFFGQAQRTKSFKNIELAPEILDVKRLRKSDLLPFEAVIISKHMQDHYPELRSLLNGFDGIVASQDKQCAITNLCALYIEKTDVIQMAVNRNVVNDRQTKYTFRSGFLKMIEQINS